MKICILKKYFYFCKLQTVEYYQKPGHSKCLPTLSNDYRMDCTSINNELDTK